MPKADQRPKGLIDLPARYDIVENIVRTTYTLLDGQSLSASMTCPDGYILIDASGSIISESSECNGQFVVINPISQDETVYYYLSLESATLPGWHREIGQVPTQEMRADANDVKELFRRITEEAWSAPFAGSADVSLINRLLAIDFTTERYEQQQAFELIYSAGDPLRSALYEIRQIAHLVR